MPLPTLLQHKSKFASHWRTQARLQAPICADDRCAFDRRSDDHSETDVNTAPLAAGLAYQDRRFIGGSREPLVPTSAEVVKFPRKKHRKTRTKASVRPAQSDVACDTTLARDTAEPVACTLLRALHATRLRPLTRDGCDGQRGGRQDQPSTSASPFRPRWRWPHLDRLRCRHCRRQYDCARLICAIVDDRSHRGAH